MTEPHVVTFGCRLNSLESEIIRREANAAGAGDAVVINTCAVTGEAVRQARQAIRKLRRDRPDSTIIVTGCAAQLTPDAFAAMPEVDRVLGNAEKLERRSYEPEERGERIVVSDIMTARETAGHLLEGFEGRSRAMVQIQQGCDHRCTFCTIPFARGPNRSVTPARIVTQVRVLSRHGFPEVVLTGVDVCSYGADLPERPTLGVLVRRLLAEVPELPRLRLSSLDPAAIDEELVAAMADEERLMPHVHLSLQAADDLVLKRMKRRHSRASALAIVERLRRARAEVVFGADVIAGFPTETEAAFANTLSFVGDAGLTYLHVFPFSPRPEAPAARMPQVPGPVRRERAAELRRAGDVAKARYFAGRVGARVEAVVETETTGRCPDYAPVALTVPARPGQIVAVDIVGATPEHLVGAPAA
jgi:threonylcarbamoyladenosine tRNA methylthiotransferase MtaB